MKIRFLVIIGLNLVNRYLEKIVMDNISQQITDIRKEWGDRLLILAHHYQRSAVVKHADESGDSLELARKASQYEKAERIVFCGVKFMAESADVLSADNQDVYMPETGAGCPMADMATAEQMEAAMQCLKQITPDWRPIVYVNSSAEVKACCGKYGGSACTSSNAERVFKWALDKGDRILFLPDEHLGFNSAHDLGVLDDEIAVYNPRKENGGLSNEEIIAAKVIVWKGFCIVHQAFTIAHVEKVRELLPDAKIIVHPESPKEVVRICDAHGSTAQIIDYVNDAPDGSTIIVGTELNLVQRLADQHKGRVIVKALVPSICANMAKTNEANLLYTLQNWPEHQVVTVAADIADDARASLDTMLAL